MSFDWKGLVRTVAPTLATAIGGPLAGAATQAVSTALLGKPDGSEDEIIQAAATATPDTLLKLKQAETDFLLKLKELGIKEEDIFAADRKDARARAISQNDKSPIYLGAVILLVWGFINIFLLMTTKPPVISDMVLGRILGMIDSVTLAFIYFIYGTSSGSQKKTDILAVRSAEDKQNQ
jgi:hypothetical protein